MSFASLWGKQVTVDTPVTINTDHLDSPLIINRAALVEGTDAVLSVIIEADSYVLGTLHKDKKDQMNLEIRFWDILAENYLIKVTGKGAKVDLTGYFLPPEDTFSDSDLPGDDSSDSGQGNVMVEEVNDDEAEMVLALEAQKKNKQSKAAGKKGKAAEKSAEQSTEKPSKKPTEKPAEQPTEKPSKKSAEKTEKTEKPEKSAEKPTEQKGGDKKRKAGGEPGEQSQPAKKQKGGKSGAFRCEPCNRSFNEVTGLAAHNKAKHGSK